MSIAMSIFSLIGTFIIGFSMLPQTINTFKTRNTAELSLLLYLVMGIATLFLTIYGIGLVIIPDPSSLSGDEQTALVNIIGNGAFSYSGSIGINNSSYLSAVRLNWIFSYVVPGAAIIFGEIICSTTSFIVAFIKLFNMYNAKKMKISEQEYILFIKNKKKSNITNITQ